MSSIDNRIVEMQFNNKQFESGVKDSISSIETLKKSLNFKETGKSLSSLEDAGKGFSLSGIANGVEAISGKFTALGIIGITTLQNITNRAINAGAALVKSLTIAPISQGFSEYELKMGSIQTIMAGTGSSLDLVNRKLDELNTYSDRTIYSFADMTSNIGKFTNAGVSLDRSVAAIQGISNAAALAGANSNEASRAMYNFAQALSSGYVKLIDWKSIELANMATVEFKTELLESAVAAGTLTKTSDGLYKTLKGNVVSATKGFNDSLQDQWMTSEALIDTLSKYSDETTDIGKRAFAAAQDVKTFSQLLDTLKEAVGSGWAKTFELTIGDFNEAKKLFTSINDVVGGFVDKTSDARNALLTGALTSGWKQLLNEGIADSGDFISTISDIAREQEIAIDDMIATSGSFENTLKDGWITSDILQQSISRLTEKVSTLSEEEMAAKGYTSENVEQLIKLNEQIQNGTLSMDEFAKKISSASGREKIFTALGNVIKFLGDIIKPVVEAFNEMFPPLTVQNLQGMIDSFLAFTEKLKVSEETADKIKRTFKGLFAIFDILKQYITAVIKGISPLFGEVDILGGGILSVTAKIGDWLVKLNELIKSSGVFNVIVSGIVKYIRVLITIIKAAVGVIYLIGKAIYTTFKKITQTFESLKQKTTKPSGALGSLISVGVSVINIFKNAVIVIKEFFKTVGKKINDGPLKLFSAVLIRIKARFEHIATSMEGFKDKAKIVFEKVADVAIKASSKIVSAFKTVKDKVTGFFSTIGEKIKNSKFFGVLKAIWKIIKIIGTAIGSFLSNLTTNFINKVESADFSSILDIVGMFGIGAITLAVVKFFKAVSKPVSSLLGFVDEAKNIIKSVTGILDSVRDCFVTYQQQLKAKVLKTIAVSIAILVAAILVLTFIDSNKLSAALGVLTILFMELMIAMKSFSKSAKGTRGLIKGAALLTSIALAILILAIALRTISKLDPESLGKSILAIAVLMTIMVASVKILASKDPKSIAKGALQIVAIALAVKILASVVKTLSGIPWPQLFKGVAAVGILVGAMTAFIDVVNNKKIKMSTIIGMFALILVLKLMAKVILEFANISWNTIAKGLVTLTVFIKAMSVFIKNTPKPKKVLSSALAMVVMAAAIQVLAWALIDISKLSWSSLAKGLLTIAVGMGVLIAALKLIPKDTGISSINILIMSAAIWVLAQALSSLANIGVGGLATAVIALAASMVVLSVGLNSMNGTISGSIALGIASIALITLSLALKKFASIKWSGIAKAIAILVAVFAVLGVAAYTLQPVVPVIMMLAGAFALLSIGMLALGLSLVAAGIGLTALAGGLLALGAIGADRAKQLVQVLSIILGGIISFIPLVLIKFGEGIIGICQVLIEGMPVIEQTLLVLVNTILNVLLVSVPKIVEVIFNLLDQILTALLEYTPKIVQTVFDILIACLEGVRNNIGKVTETAIEIVIEFINAISNKLPDVIDAGFKLIISFVDGLARAIDNNAETLINKISDLISSLITAAVIALASGPEILLKIGKKLMDSGLIAGIKEKASGLWTAIKEGVSNAIDKAKGKVKDFLGVGKDMVLGLVQGVKDYAFKIWDNIKDAVSGALNKVKDFLGIQSPSTVFAEIGRYCDEGMAVGLKKYSGKVSDASEEVGQTSINTLKDTLSGLSSVIDENVDSNPTIRPVMDLTNIQNGANQLYKMMGNIDGYAISGSLKPAYNKASSISNTRKNQEDPNGALLESLGKLTNNSKEQQPNIFENTFNIKGDNPKEIAEEVSRIIQKQVERRDAAWA